MEQAPRRSRFVALLILGGATAGALAYVAARPYGAVASSHHPSGTNLSVRPFLDGRPNRAWVTWYEDRWKESESRYDRGAATATWTRYGRPFRGPDGEGSQAALLRVQFNGGEFDGPLERAFPDGSPREAGMYDRGLRHGAWRLHREPGAPAEVRWWWRGHDLGLGPEAEGRFRALEAAPPQDRATLERYLEEA